MMTITVGKTSMGSVKGSSRHRFQFVFSSKSSGFQKVFRLQENKKPVSLIPSGLENVFEKFHFCDGLVWTVGLKKINRRNRAAFSKFSGVG